MNRIIVFFVAISIGLSAQAFQWSSLFSQPYMSQPYQQYPPYPSYQSFVPTQTEQVVNYPDNQNYVQPYNQTYYQNTYPVQYQGQYNPYQYQRPYGYGNNVPYAPVGSVNQGNTNGTSQIVKNIGQSLIYSMINGRGY